MLRIAWWTQAESVERIEPLLFKLAVALPAQAQESLVPWSNAARQPGIGTRTRAQGAAKRRAGRELVVSSGLIVKHALLARLAAGVWPLVIERVGVQVTHAQCPPR